VGGTMKKILLSFCLLLLFSLPLSHSNAMYQYNNNHDRKSPAPLPRYTSQCCCHTRLLTVHEAYAEAIYHFTITDYARALTQLLTIISDNHHAGACYYLALIYFYGYGCEPDITKALQYCTIASAHHITGAQELCTKIQNAHKEIPD